jgi:Kef-type K+ transport system membrane component KefB
VSGLLELGLIMVVAITGKFGGTWVCARSQGLPSRDSAVLATLMNTRGLTELIALSIGLQIGVLDNRLYSLMVVMAVVTTAMTGPPDGQSGTTVINNGPPGTGVPPGYPYEVVRPLESFSVNAPLYWRGARSNGR